MKNALIYGVVFAIFIAARAMAADPCTDPVATGPGQVSGLSEKDSNTCVYRGIPYAAPPVGNLRWRSPQPAEPWTGVRVADQWGARCMQSGLMNAINADPSKKMSEDCLYLNIWRPKKSGSFPVMVWIYGGGYSGGTANSPMYWGDRLAEAGDVVVVAVSYRLNVFGFLTSPALKAEDKNGSVGSYGSLDQVAGLKWVHDNIAAFGGDPGNVTIFGESAGGWSVCTMLATPLASGLIHRAIIESGGCNISETVEQGDNVSRPVAESLGCKLADLDCLRALPAEKLLQAATGGILDGMVWIPHHDGYLLTDTPLKMIRAGKHNHIPVMAGHNAAELDSFLGLLPGVKYASRAGLPGLAKKHMAMNDREAARLAELYTQSRFKNTGRAFEAAASDGALACPTYTGMAAASGAAPAFFYRFDYAGAIMPHSAIHSMEIPFVFDSFDRRPISMLYPKKIKPATVELSRIIQGYWLNFARTGDPNGGPNGNGPNGNGPNGGLPAWPRFTIDAPRVQVLDAAVRTEDFGNADQCRFWDDYDQTHPLLVQTLTKILKP